MSSRYRSRLGQHAVRDWCERKLCDWEVPHTRCEVETSAGTTHLVVAGSGPATVLYLPGTNFNAATSLPLARELARKARVALADLPGQPGLSEGTRPSGDRVTAYGAWAGEITSWIRESLSPGFLALIGHSLGAAVALATPTRGIDALVLLDPAGFVRLRVPPRVLRTTLPWLLRPTEQRSRALLAHMTAPDRSPDRRLVEWMTLVARHTKPTGAPSSLPSAVTTQWSATPRIVLSGEHDCFLLPKLLGPAVQEHLQVELEVLPGMAHLSVDDNPVGVAARITRALPTETRTAAPSAGG